MIRRVISLLIALAGAAVLYGWWQRDHDVPDPSLTPLATVPADSAAESASMSSGEAEAQARDDEAAPSESVPEGASDSEAEAATRTAGAGWTPTLIEFDRDDRNAPTVVLQRADAALAAGRLIEPPGDNAVDFYYSVLDAAPKNARARSGLNRTLDRIEADIGRAFESGDYPGVARLLPVLEQLRADTPAPAQFRKRIDEVEPQRQALERAVRAMERGRLDTGSRNAVTYFRQVLEKEPDNATARAGIAAVQQRLVQEAQKNAQSGEFETAEALLERASKVEPGALQVLTDAYASVKSERTKAAASLLLQAHARLDDSESDEAEQLLDQALAVDSDVTGASLVRERIRNVRLYGGYGEGERFRDTLSGGGEAPAMVVIPVGSFLMGSPDNEDGRRANEGPQFRVRFDRGFAIAEAEVTVGDFRRFVEATDYRTQAEKNGGSSIYDERSGSMRERGGIDWRNDEHGQQAIDAHPVVHVGWSDAIAYTRWLSEQTGRTYRLPSEAEFEYALRAGSVTRYPWGDAAPVSPLTNVSSAGDRSRNRREWSNAFPGESDGFFGIAPVRSFAANAFGLLDMDGNVSEWVEDCWHSTYARAPSDGRAWVNPGCSRRVVRGASWASGPEQVRSAYRLSIAPTTTSPRVGFRVARGF